MGLHSPRRKRRITCEDPPPGLISNRPEFFTYNGTTINVPVIDIGPNMNPNNKGGSTASSINRGAETLLRGQLDAPYCVVLGGFGK